jgi:hypothetical protein
MSNHDIRGTKVPDVKEYKNPKGERILGGHANGSITFQMAQLKVGPGKVPISIVLYIDATFIKRGIPIRPIYCESVYDIIYDIIYNMISSMISCMISYMISMYDVSI